MGNRASHDFEEMQDVEDSVSRSQHSAILMVGLDGAGKTTLLYRMKQDEAVPTVPTIGFNVETVQFQNMSFNVWDVGSQNSKIRPLWRRYFEQAQGLIFVVDSTDHERVEMAKAELAEILAEKSMRNTAVLILANKQDLPQAMPKHEVAAKLGLDRLQLSRCAVKPVCAVDGSGLSDALAWLTAEIAGEKKSRSPLRSAGPEMAGHKKSRSPLRSPRSLLAKIGRGGKGFGKQSFL